MISFQYWNPFQKKVFIEEPDLGDTSLFLKPEPNFQNNGEY